VISIFRDKSIASIFALVICGLLIHLHIFYIPVAINANSNNGVLSWLLLEFFTKLKPVAINTIYIALVIIQAIRLNLVLNNSKMYSKSGFTAAFAYLLLSGLMVNAYSLSPALVVTSLLIWIVKDIFLLYNNSEAKGLIFNIGFLSTLSFILYTPSAVIIVAILFSLAILRPFKTAEWFIVLLGIIAPAYLLLAVLFLTDKFYLLSHFIPQIHLRLSINKEPWYWASLSVTIILIIAGLISWYPNSNRMVIQTRKNWVVMLIISVLLLISLLLFNSNNQFPEVLCMFPMAAFVANYFMYTQRTILANFIVLASSSIIVYHLLQLIR